MKTYRMADLVNKHTDGVAIPVLCNPELAKCPQSAQLLGTVNNNRGRWNSFLPENNMIPDGNSYYKQILLKTNGGRHGNGIYAFRFVTNHNLYETCKANHNQLDLNGKPQLVTGEHAHQAQNILIQVHEDGPYMFHFDPTRLTFDIFPRPAYLTRIESVQINGFVWDEENMFQKFDETRQNHEMTKNMDWWEITLYLRSNGGLDFRSDGVYQFLFSANHNEDWGFGAYNDGHYTLTGGTGFGSSGGQSRHSAITINVFQDSLYTIRMNPQTYRFEVQAPDGVSQPKLLNSVESFQLLCTVYQDAQFDPTHPPKFMENTHDQVWTKTMEIDPGVYGANFAISQELCLDTMAIGAWLVSDKPNKLTGRAWHGKPNEPNIFFEVHQKGAYQFTYDAATDEFSIEALSQQEASFSEPLLVEAHSIIETLQLVGSFDEPLQAWDPMSFANNMDRAGGKSLFVKDVYLEAGRTYEYKYTANNWGWIWVFADYELDGYGQDFLGKNPDAVNSRLEDLKVYGHLTTHANPPALQVKPSVTGYYTFMVNLETGAYSVSLSNSKGS